MTYTDLDKYVILMRTMNLMLHMLSTGIPGDDRTAIAARLVARVCEKPKSPTEEELRQELEFLLTEMERGS